MAKDLLMHIWPRDPFLQGYYEPLTAECTAPDLVSEGDIPLDLNAIFYRNEPNPQFTPPTRLSLLRRAHEQSESL